MVKKLKHLELIQDVINRLANSFIFFKDATLFYLTILLVIAIVLLWQLIGQGNGG